MSHRDPEVLAGIAADPAESTLEDAAHLASCETCTSELDAFRRVVDLARPAPDVALTPPPPALWARIEAEVAHARPLPQAEPPLPQGEPPLRQAVAPVPLDAGPPVVSLDAARARRAIPSDTRRAARRSPNPWWWALGAAAAGLAIGLRGGRLLWFEPAPQATLLARTPLQTLDTQQPLGDADLVQRADAVSLAVGLQPVDPGEGYLEVWLINRDLTRMVSVGILPDGSSGTFPVARGLIDAGYLIVDVSREGLDDKPQHSGDSVVRGQLSL